MTRKDILKTILLDSQERSTPETWERRLKVPTDTKKIITLTGVRRSGKTHLLLATMRKLKQEGVAKERLLYINFEDERLDLKGSELDAILQAYRELYPKQNLADCYFFFDEVQEIEGWEKFVNRVYRDITQNLFITGSNSRLLSREIASGLRGRPITFEVYPLSFSEFVEVMEPGLNAHSSADQATLVNYFTQFLHQGGFPELVSQQEELREQILQAYFNVMLFHDLIERNNITQTAILKYFCKRVIGASAGEFSVNKVYNELKSQRYKIGKDTLYSFQENVEDIYMARFIPRYSESVVKTEGAAKKPYVIDQGLGAALDFKLSQDDGRLLETTVALELLKQGKQIAYYQDGGECDFVVIEKGEVTEALQVSHDVIDEQTQKREIRGLVQCAKRFGLNRGMVLTFNREDSFTNEGVNIHYIPAWKYFLS